MAAIGDVVRLSNGWIGVVGEDVSTPDTVRWRVFFPNSRLDVPETDIDSSLDPVTYAVGQTVTVWPYQGEVQSIDSDQVTVRLDRTEVLSSGRQSWEPDVTVPLWRLIRDHATRLARDIRSEERCVGKGSGSTGRTRGSP